MRSAICLGCRRASGSLSFKATDRIGLGFRMCMCERHTEFTINALSANLNSAATARSRIQRSPCRINDRPAAIGNFKPHPEFGASITTPCSFAPRLATVRCLCFTSLTRLHFLLLLIVTHEPKWPRSYERERPRPSRRLRIYERERPRLNKRLGSYEQRRPRPNKRLRSYERQRPKPNKRLRSYERERPTPNKRLRSYETRAPEADQAANRPESNAQNPKHCLHHRCPRCLRSTRSTTSHAFRLSARLGASLWRPNLPARWSIRVSTILTHLLLAGSTS